MDVQCDPVPVMVGHCTRLRWWLRSDRTGPEVYRSFDHPRFIPSALGKERVQHG
jgi:hypothetical protein